jgi:dihydromethanopterin reductase
LGGQSRPRYVADVERFFELTRGHVFIMGHRTFTSAPYFAFKDRDIVEIHASDRPEDMTGALSEPRRLHRRRPARLCRLCADRWFDPARLVAGGHRV